MPLRDILKKKEKIADCYPTDAPPPQFTFIRSDTSTQESISPPSFQQHRQQRPELHDVEPLEATQEKSNRLSIFHRRSRANSSTSSTPGSPSQSLSPEHDNQSSSSSSKRLSERLHIGRRETVSSAAVPLYLPEIMDDRDPDAEGKWEHRATMLARENERNMSRSVTPEPSSRESGVVASKHTDDNIQEAIRLHECGDLVQATKMFGRLADPQGENNALSQVLYGLALRHGWGCTADPQKAMIYLSAAAANAASIEDQALRAGQKKGGAAKGELVLAIFELANSFRHGWGVKKDPIAAKQYYETAANLGDTDAMNEVAWCYLEGFGCKKDKLASAKYYRLAESGGNKTLGNTWIWKPKYDPLSN